MKVFGALSLALVVLLYGMPLSAFAQDSSTVFTLPGGTAGEAYRANTAKVLRENYQLGLETSSRASVFRWSLAQGEIPPGLIMRTNGTIVGMPRTGRAEPYRFQLKVVDVSTPNRAALTLEFSMTISAPRIRLAHINAPKLVSLTEVANTPPKSKRDTQRTFDLSTNSKALTVASDERSAASVYSSMLKRRPSPAKRTISAMVQVDAPCDPSTAPGPSAVPAGYKEVILDARTGTATYETLRFKKSDKIRVTIDNKNPFLYSYKYSSTATDVAEPALAVFLPLLGGIVGEVGSSESAPKQSDGAKAMDAACGNTQVAVRSLVDDIEQAAARAQTLATDVATLKADGDVLQRAYASGRQKLRDRNKTRGQLYCASKNFLRDTEGRVVTDDLEDAQETNESLEEWAKGFGPRIKAIIEHNPENCLDTQFLYRAGIFANGLLDAVKKNKEVLTSITSLSDNVDKTRDSVSAVLDNTTAFFEVHTEGDFEVTKDVEIKLELTPLEKDIAAAGPYKLSFKMGSAPLLSLSAGMVFSPLRKFEFDRIQGFERDEQGNLVLVNGKPNLTTVVGLKETSRTRITPIVLLNGRVHEWNSGPIDGLHISLGLTAKNDNKGLDPEFLVGPSLSMLERKLFFTFGGYAGRQQKLTGGLFEGFAVPSTVTDLPIQKNYRWSFGFALSYQLPIKSNGK